MPVRLEGLIRLSATKFQKNPNSTYTGKLNNTQYLEAVVNERVGTYSSADPYLELLDGHMRVFEGIVSASGMTAEECLEQAELDEIYQRTALHHRQLGELVQASHVWLDAKTMQTPLLSTGSGTAGNHQMLITWRTIGQQMRYATDPKGGTTAFYGFDRNGAPFCFVRGDHIVLFDSDGSALYSTYSEKEADVLYTFSRFLQEKKNGFRKAEYDQYQSVY